MIVDINKEKLDLTRRTIELSFENIFHKLNQKKVAETLYFYQNEEDSHYRLALIARSLDRSQGSGYNSMIKTHGFYSGDQEFTNHCHQSTPILALNLKLVGKFDQLAYLECYRIKDHFSETGICEKVLPQEETDLKLRDEFITLGRIPYCNLEVTIQGQKFYVSAKHVKINEEGEDDLKVPLGSPTLAALTPECYRSVVGVKYPAIHQSDPSKSAIYLATVTPKENPSGIDFSKYPVWKKQVPGKDPKPEYFATYLRMELK